MMEESPMIELKTGSPGETGGTLNIDGSYFELL